MATAIRRTKTCHLHQLKIHGGARTNFWLPAAAGQAVREVQITHQPALSGATPFKTPLNPPPHWHWYQDEYFTVKRGTFVFLLEGTTLTCPPSPIPIVVPKGARHTFWCSPLSPECEIDISVAPAIPSHPSPSPTAPSPKTSSAPSSQHEEKLSTILIPQEGMSERFFRNLYSYLDDCHTQSAPRSYIQVITFLHSAQVSVAWLWVPSWLWPAVRPLTWLYGCVLSWYGKVVLGYRDSYEEYYDPKMDMALRGDLGRGAEKECCADGVEVEMKGSARRWGRRT